VFRRLRRQTESRLNGQLTNTILSGTTGYIAIYGSCLNGSTPGVSVDGTGIQITSVPYSSPGQINAYYQASGTATGGTHNLIVSTSGGSSSQRVFATSVMLQSFSFTGTGSIAYSRDCDGNATPISQPTWPAPTNTPGSNPPTPVACPQTATYSGDHAVYASGNTITGIATFALSPAPQQGVTGFYVQGTAGGFGTFSASNVTVPANNGSFQVNVTDATALATHQTQFINPLNISWSVAQAGTSCTNPTYACVAVGTSSNPVYVTLSTPVFSPASFGPTMLTYVSLAVGTTGGATSQSTALANTWAQFSNTACGAGIVSCPANVKTWDGRSMQYYTSGFSTCATVATQIVQNLPTPSAQCGAFAYLLESALAMNGIHSNWITVQATDNVSAMVINNWCVIGAAPPCPQGQPSYQNTSPSVAPWIYQLILNPGDGGAGMFPPLASYGNLTNIQGLAGQGETGAGTPPYTPVEKAFGAHFIVQIPIAAGNQYYDPSYGVTYPSPAGFESQAVAGYATTITPDSGGNFHFRIYSTLPPNITFTLIAARSM
jgi:hypothetical protein